MTSGGFADVLEANAAYAATFAHAHVPPRPARRLAVVTCMDARLDPLPLLGLQPGDAKVVRNAGARVTDDVVRALGLATQVLGVERVMLLAHTDCAAVSAEEQADAIRADVARLGGDPNFADVEVGGFMYDVATGRVSRLC